MAYCVNCMNESNGMICSTCGMNRDDYVVAAHHLAPGMVLNGKYLIGAVLGEGGFGITYIGRDINLDIKVAVKEYFPSGIVNRSNTSTNDITALVGASESVFKKGKSGFLSEARILAKFSSDSNIVAVRDFFEENNTAYIVMEYLEGMTLKEYISKNGMMSFDSASEMLLPIMESLSKIHSLGLIHRDISPSNIMITKDGLIKLLDFGATRNISGVDEKSLSVMLKPGYAPEEQYRSKGVQGPWTDIYALCATFYKMVTGVTPDDAMNRLFSDEVKSPSLINPNIPDDVSSVILKGMSINQKDRYSCIEELKSAIVTCLDNKDISRINEVELNKQEIGVVDFTESSNEEKTIFDFSVSDQTVHDNISKRKDKKEFVVATEEKNKDHPISKNSIAKTTKTVKTPKIWGLVGSIVFGLLALFMVFEIIAGAGDVSRESSDNVSSAIWAVVFGLTAGAFGYFYYPRVDVKSKKPNVLAFIISDVLAVVSLVTLGLGFNAFNSEVSQTGTGEAFLSFAFLFFAFAVYLGYFYYPRLEKKKKNKLFKAYGIVLALLIAFFVIFTVFSTLNSVSIGDKEVKKNAESVEIYADLLTNEDIEKLTQLKNLKRLYINACFLDDDDVKTLSEITQLEKLSLVGNTDIEDISPLSNLSALTYLDLELTGVEDISCLSKLTDLTSLRISETNVEDVSVISELSVLETLYMDNLKNIDESTIELPLTVTTFSCNNNELTNIEFLEDNIALSVVKLDGNNLSDLSPLALKPLYSVHVSNNQLVDISPISNVGYELYASDNQISDISCLENSKIEFIDLANNSIFDISAFKDNHHIINLNLSNNKVEDISVLSECFNISNLDLNNNKITDISALATIDELNILNLSFNNITDISSLAQNKNYINTDSAIHLENNKIVDISALSNFNNCKNIWIDNNMVEDISPISNCSALELLSMENNKVSDISVLSNMPSLGMLYTVGNPITKIDGISLNGGEPVLGNSILKISYTDSIDWEMAKALNIDDIRVFDIPPRQIKMMSGLGYETYYSSTQQEGGNE